MNRKWTKWNGAGALAWLGVLTLLCIGGSAQADEKVNLDSRGQPERERVNLDSRGRIEHPIPELSAALVFGAGLLVASRLARKR